MNPDQQTLVIIREATRALIEHAAGHTRESFDADRKSRSAVLFEIVLQGEGAKRLSGGFRDRNPEIPWSQIAGMRDRIVHSFDAISFDIVWEVVQVHAPAVLSDLDRIIATEHRS
jgi:uncharacterized protein with HEPN domain